MSKFKIEITVEGLAGLEKSKKDGEIIDFKSEGKGTVEAKTLDFIKTVFSEGVVSAEIINWPGDTTEVRDNLLTGERTGFFQ